MLTWLSGYKTYFISAAMIILAGLHAQDYLSDSLYNTLVAILTGAGFATLRAGIKKVGS